MADQCINSNPDIAGIGIRVNFYVTILLTALTPKNKYTTDLLDGLYKGAILYGLALNITAVIQTMQNQMDLYHALYVMYNLISLEFVYVCGQIRYLLSSKKDLRMRTFIAVQMSSTVLFLYWLLYVWIKGSKFGSQPECNHLVKFVLLFFNVMATKTWLRVFIILYALAYLGWMTLIFSVTLMVYFHTYMPKKLQAVVNVFSPKGQQVKDFLHKHHWLRIIREVLLVYVAAVPAVYCVVTLELIVQRNSPNIKPGEDAWGFGQIIALVLLSGSFIDVGVTIFEWRERKGKGLTSESSYETLSQTHADSES